MVSFFFIQWRVQRLTVSLEKYTWILCNSLLRITRGLTAVLYLIFKAGASPAKIPELVWNWLRKG